MPYGPRVAETSPILAEGDKLYFFAVYGDTSGQLVAFAPVYKDLTDAAEYDSLNATTALTAATNSPWVGKATAGRVVLGSSVLANSNAGASAGVQSPFVGIYSPTNPSDRPSTGDVIRLTKIGATPVAISAGQSPNVGDYIIADGVQNLALTRQRIAGSTLRPSVGQMIGYVMATTAYASVGQAITTVPTAPGPAPFSFLINGWIDPR